MNDHGIARFAFFGTPYVARDTLAMLLEAGYVPSVVVTSPDAARGRGLALAPTETKTLAELHGIPVLTPDKLDGEFLAELWAFMRERKKFWLLPIIVISVVLGGLLVLAQGSAVAPFIYTLF